LALSTGDLLGPYEIIAPLGKGGMGEVYRARDVRLGREVALKVLPETGANDADTLARFEREARAVAALNHPNILSIHDTGEHRGVPYAVTELLEGENLSDRLRTGPVAAKRATEIACQIADGLSAAHARGVIHRDIKPENIFLTNDGRAKILDFGIARIGPRPGDITTGAAARGGTSSQFIMGTAGYMSPEQVRGKTIDFRTDIFSLGAVFYEMLTGRRAFDRPGMVETMTSVLKDDPSKFTDTEKIPQEIRAFIFRSLEKDPADRYQTARDLLLDLRAFQAEQTHEAAERVQFRAEPPWKHRRTRVLLRAAGGVLLFVLGFWAGSCWQSPHLGSAGPTGGSASPESSPASR
jgi:serine/threonine protein kinase